MNSIESLKLDFNSQIKQLYYIHNKKLFDDCIYLGTGECPALYASLQMSEFFGSTAAAHKLEEFCHSPIFGFKKTHYLYGAYDQNEDK